MYDYVTKELPEVVAANFAVDTANGAYPRSPGLAISVQVCSSCGAVVWPKLKGNHIFACLNQRNLCSLDHGPLYGWTRRPHHRPEEPWR